AQPEAAPEVAADAQPEAAPEVAAAPEVQAAPVAAPAEPGKAPEFKNDALAPLANAGSHIKDAKINEVISFSMKSTKKNPKGGAIVGGSWDFGDGSTADTGDAKHAYAQQGTYYAVLTVKDDAGRTAKAVRTIEVYRPENKIKFTTKSLEDLKAVTATAPTISDKFEKTFSGSQVTMEASGYMLAADHCKCELIVNLKGPGCTVKRAKSVSDGGEGDLSVKAQCKGELGEYTWSVERKVTGNCQCTFQNIKLEGFES
ncbi:MAG: PKD domain-containing protein, partial [Proteobacteria bacterium]|nr:PKD domain-containing protein [Pseudomonadota bacterium]